MSVFLSCLKLLFVLVCVYLLTYSFLCIVYRLILAFSICQSKKVLDFKTNMMKCVNKFANYNIDSIIGIVGKDNPKDSIFLGAEIASFSITFNSVIIRKNKFILSMLLLFFNPDTVKNILFKNKIKDSYSLTRKVEDYVKKINIIGKGQVPQK